MWSIVTSFTEVEGGEPVMSYGISCGSTTIYDISINRKEIEAFVEKLNRLGASEVHAYDLVEDELGK